MTARLRSACLRTALFVAGSCLASSSMTPAFASGIRVVDNPGLPAFSTLQAAIDAAPDGGLLLIQTGLYAGAVIDNKSITIVGMPGFLPRLTSTLTVRNLAATKRVVLASIEGRPTTGAAVALLNDVGSVRFQSCKFTGGTTNFSSWGADGAPGIDAQSSQETVLSSCQVYGGNASQYPGSTGMAGGPALLSTSSNTVLYDCTLQGGHGGEEGSPGGNGGNAITLTNWGLFASGCTISGGLAGGGDYIGCNDGGYGGNALDVNTAVVQLLDNTLNPGPGGWSSCGPYSPPGVTIHNVGGTVNQISGSRRKLAAAAVAADDTLLTVTVTGQVGDRFYLLRSQSTSYAYQAALHGTWTIPSNTPAVARDIIPAGGVLTMQVRVADLVGIDHRREIFQGYCLDAAGQRFLTGPVHVEFLDVMGGPDCDGSGANDFVQLYNGAPDCNHNVNLDSCDIASGTSQDANQNGIPDECTGG
jgi:hypothetical protein